VYNTVAYNQLSEGRSARADLIHRLFKEAGVDFASGVPCGVLKHIIKNLSEDTSVLHIPANRESEAIGLVAGAFLAGRTPVVYMQNSGLFAASNDIASLLVPYKIPVILTVSYRGCEGEDAVQHIATGRATEKLLEALGLPYDIIGTIDIYSQIRSLIGTMKRTGLPTVLLLKRGWQNE